jgi:hypothetical protein
MARFGLKIRLPTQVAAFFAGGDGAWWSRGENRFGSDKISRFKDLADLWLQLV